MRILIDNDADLAALTVSSEDGSYPVTNIQDSRLSRIWHSDDVTSENIVFDMASAMVADFIAIGNHNLTSGATITLEANSADSWGAPLLSVSLTWDAGIIMKAFTSGSYRYWRLVIADATNTDGFIKIGRVGLGEYYQLPNFTTNYTRVTKSTSKVIKSRTGQLYGNIGYQYLNYKFQWPDISTAVRAALVTMFESLDILTPSFFQFEETQITEGGLYARISFRGLQFQGKGDDPVFYGSRFELEEAF